MKKQFRYTIYRTLTRRMVSANMLMPLQNQWLGIGLSEMSADTTAKRGFLCPLHGLAQRYGRGCAGARKSGRCSDYR